MLKEEWSAKRALLESALEKELNIEQAVNKTLAESMLYSLMAGGKRLRPVLLMEAAEAVGGHGEDYLKAACALEMIHTYSLIHDDLPAMDNDDYRRGKLTNHKVYGAGIATLAGDALLTLAFEVILRQKAAPDVLCRVIREISQAAGPDGMIGGQAIDVESEGKHIPMDLLRKMHMGKTGALFRASIRSGAILASADDVQLEALTKYADAFGLAFQITDDILDVIGDEQEIGKPVGSDERNHKSTYVTLTSLETAQKLAHEAVDEAVDAIVPLGEKAQFLKELVEFLISRKN